MRQFEVTRQFQGALITAQVLCFPQGVHISLFGGTLPHIGAVSIIDPKKNCMTTQFPGHKDGVVSARWAEVLLQHCLCPAVIEVGIHYDDLSKAEIAAICSLTDEMLAELLSMFKEVS